MAVCPNCKHSFKEEVFITFDNYKEWNAYVNKHMAKAERFHLGAKTSIQTLPGVKHDGRVLAEWDGFDYGYVSEARHNGLERLTYNHGWGGV